MKTDKKLPFGKNDHVKLIKAIAIGLQDAGVLNTYCELGIRKGACFNNIAPLVKGNAYAVDIENCKRFIEQNKNLVWFHGKTTDFLASYKGMKFDLVFIDADHSHESSLNDFNTVFPLVNDNGLILLHDTYPPNEIFISKSYCSDTYKTADYIRKNCNHICEIVTFPAYFGVSIVRKLNKQLLWMK